MSRRFFSRWGKRERVIAAWTVAVILIVAVLEIVIAIVVGPQEDDFGIDIKGTLLFLTFVGGFVAWGLGRGVIAAVAGFLDWRNDLQHIREVRARNTPPRTS